MPASSVCCARAGFQWHSFKFLSFLSLFSLSSTQTAFPSRPEVKLRQQQQQISSAQPPPCKCIQHLWYVCLVSSLQYLLIHLPDTLGSIYTDLPSLHPCPNTPRNLFPAVCSPAEQTASCILRRHPSAPIPISSLIQGFRGSLRVWEVFLVPSLSSGTLGCCHCGGKLRSVP